MAGSSRLAAVVRADDGPVLDKSLRALTDSMKITVRSSRKKLPAEEPRVLPVAPPPKVGGGRPADIPEHGERPDQENAEGEET